MELLESQKSSFSITYNYIFLGLFKRFYVDHLRRPQNRSKLFLIMIPQKRESLGDNIPLLLERGIIRSFFIIRIE